MYRIEFLSFTPIKMKETLLFKCSGACFRYIVIYSANVFLSHSGIPANAKQSKNIGKRMETAMVHHSPTFLPIYNPPSLPSDEDRQN